MSLDEAVAAVNVWIEEIDRYSFTRGPCQSSESPKW